MVVIDDDVDDDILMDVYLQYIYFLELRLIVYYLQAREYIITLSSNLNPLLLVTWVFHYAWVLCVSSHMSNMLLMFSGCYLCYSVCYIVKYINIGHVIKYML